MFRYTDGSSLALLELQLRFTSSFFGHSEGRASNRFRETIIVGLTGNRRRMDDGFVPLSQERNASLVCMSNAIALWTTFYRRISQRHTALIMDISPLSVSKAVSSGAPNMIIASSCPSFHSLSSPLLRLQLTWSAYLRSSTM